MQESLEHHKALNYYVVKASFKESSKKYTFKTKLANLKVGNLCLVTTMHGISVVQVRKIDPLTQHDLDQFDLEIAFQKIDESFMHECHNETFTSS